METRYKPREIKFFNNFSKIASMAEYRSIHGEGLKTLSTKQMLQRIPILLTQVRGDNSSEKLLNKIRQIIFSLY